MIHTSPILVALTIIAFGLLGMAIGYERGFKRGHKAGTEETENRMFAALRKFNDPK